MMDDEFRMSNWPGFALRTSQVVIALVHGGNVELRVGEDDVEAADRMGAEKVVGALLASANLGAALGLDFAVLRDEAGAVLDVPAEGAEEGVEEFLAEAGFVVGAALVGREVPAEGFDQAVQLGLKGFEVGGF